MRCSGGDVNKENLINEILGIVLMLVAAILFLSIASFNIADYKLLLANEKVHNIIGPIGALFSYFFRSAFGFSAYFISIIFIFMGWTILKGRHISESMGKIFAIFFMIISIASLIAIFSKSTPQLEGGYVGLYIFSFLKTITGNIGGYLIIAIMNLIGLILLGIVSISTLLENNIETLNLTEKAKAIASRFSYLKINAPFINFKVNKNLQVNGDMEANNEFQEMDAIDKTKAKPKKKKVPWITKKKIVINKKTKEEPEKLLLPDTWSVIKNEEYTQTEQSNETIKDALAVSALAVEPTVKRSEKVTIINNQKPDYSISSIEVGESSPDIEDNNSFTTINDLIEQAEDKSSFSDDDSFDYEIEHYSQSNGTEATHTIEDTEEEYSTPIDTEPKITKSISKLKETSTKEETKKIFEEIPIHETYSVPKDYFTDSVPLDSESWKNEIRRNSVLLINTLADFGIEAKVVHVHRGPVITLYELQIAPGIKVNKIVGLSDDIAMALAAYRVRIVAPIPGKSAIGVEIPNREREYVTLGDIIKTDEYQQFKGTLKVALGKDILGKPIMLDIRKLPHLLIAGATGSGKSVCVNTIITSLIFNYDPNHLRFILVDPKMVELQLYNGMPHLLTPVITEPHMAPTIMKWAIYEMERRYRMLSVLSARDIEKYNSKITSEKEEKLPYIVIIIDELADLMMVASKEMEGYITRIAQKARAVGIHLVLATQRPSVDVITGIIKANFPARIAFQVAQKTDSRTIIDQNGSEKLLGKGDMLYQSPMSSFPVRIQGAYISEEEILSVVNHLHQYGEPEFIDIEEHIFAAEENEHNGHEEQDELFVEALKIIEETRKASASYLQRRLSIGYNRAARIIEQMEELGYIGPQQGSKPREVFI